MKIIPGANSSGNPVNHRFWGIMLICIGLFPAITPLATITPTKIANNLFMTHFSSSTDFARVLIPHAPQVSVERLKSPA
jgi:hypothetical protein